MFKTHKSVLATQSASCVVTLTSRVVTLTLTSPCRPPPGVISVLKPLDYETGRDYFLTVEAWDGGTPPLSAVTTVNINLTDVNDNAPMFSYDLYTAAVSEDAAVDTFIVKVGYGHLYCEGRMWSISTPWCNKVKKSVSDQLFCFCCFSGVEWWGQQTPRLLPAEAPPS